MNGKKGQNKKITSYELRINFDLLGIETINITRIFMRLLIVNPTMDIADDNQFMLSLWINKLLNEFSSIKVITLKKGRIIDNPKLEVFGLNQYKSKLLKFWHFYRKLTQWMPKSDVVLTQMFPEFPLFVYPVSLIYKKPMAMYYAHSGISFRLWLAHKLVQKVITTSASGFKLSSSKCSIIGQGIDTKFFKPQKKANSKVNYIVCLDRIDYAKGHDVTIKALGLIRDNNLAELPEVRFYGRKNEQFYSYIKSLTNELNLTDVIKFYDPVTYKKIPEIIANSLFFASGCRIGSMSKASLEAMSCGKPAVLSEKDFSSTFGKYKELLLYERNNYKDLAYKIAFLLNNKKLLHTIGCYLRENIVKYHDIDKFTHRLADILNALAK